MKQLLLSVLLLVGSTCSVWAQGRSEDVLPTNPGPNNGYACGTPGFLTSYQPAPIRQFAELPDSIRARLLLHLRERLGPALVARLDFVGGTRVDLPALRRAEAAERASTRHWTAYSYYLCLALRDVLSNGLPYQTSIALDSAGGVGEEIRLPDVGADPATATIVGPEKAQRLARWYGLRRFRWGPRELQAQLVYNMAAGRLIWLVKHFSTRGNHYVTQVTRLDAHTGRLLRQWTKKRYMDW